MKNRIADRIEELEKLGFNHWEKGTFNRLYINATFIGLECEYYKTGNIASATFNGERISNSQGYRYKAAKTYIDVETEKVYSTYPELAEAAAKLAGIN